MSFFITGTGNRTVVGYDGNACEAPIFALETSPKSSSSSSS